MDKQKVLGEIKGFLEGYNHDLKYLVNVETDSRTNIAECIIHEPNKPPRIQSIMYEPFMYMKDLSRTKYKLYEGQSEQLIRSKQIKYGIKIHTLKTGNQKRLVEGFCFKITSSRSYHDIIQYLTDGGLNPYEKQKDMYGEFVRDAKGEYIFPYKDLFYAPRTTEQFFISRQTRLYKGFEEYKQVHKLTFDIETTGLRYQIARVFAIGVRDNRGFETILEADKLNDDEAEIRLIQDFFNIINYIKPAVISGFNSEMFDFEFILGRAKILKMDLTAIPTTLNDMVSLRRRPNTSVKYGSTTDKYTATEMWGYSVIDILHAAKKTAAINSDLKETKLKYIAKFEKIAKPDRTYINGEENTIGKYYYENKMFVIDPKNNYEQIPEEFQGSAKVLYLLQANKERIGEEDYKKRRNACFSENPKFADWLRTEAVPKGMTMFIGGKRLVKQYLLDDLWETEHVDELYNQSSFMLAKIVPTTYQRICTMGTASIWNLLITTWSYENDLAIPDPDVQQNFSGGLARTFQIGFYKRLVKIDYASLYPMIQLTENVFPIFDITGVMKKILLYLTTTRNIYKRIANGDELKAEEVILLKEIDPDIYHRYVDKTLTAADLMMSKIKQLPIKILNNSLFGALGSNISFNWSDNDCAARITCIGRIQLRHAIKWFRQFGCIPLLAVTDGINFKIPDTTTIKVTEAGILYNQPEDTIENMWKVNGKEGIAGLITYYNKTEMKPPYMSVDNDGEFLSCLNLARINYATLSLVKDKKTGEMKEKVKLTGNTIKSKVMPDYIKDFIDEGLNLILHGKGYEFVQYYQDYSEKILYNRIPLKKIASKSRLNSTITAYQKRGTNKNGKEKGKQAHMELLIEKRNKIAMQLFEKHKDEFNLTKVKKLDDINTILKLVANYMPPEPELDSVVYYYNSGYKKSHGDSRIIKDAETGEERFAATLISNEDLLENPNMLGKYNVDKYLDAFNSRAKSILVCFDPEVAAKIPLKKNKKGEITKEMFTREQCELKGYDLDSFEGGMVLEEMEVDFWNKTGFDPRKIWDGFTMRDDYKVHYEIYENALNFLNDKMKASGKPLIKSINEEYVSGDLVLLKDGAEYRVGVYNGVYIQIIKPKVEVPKSELELELDRRREENQKKIDSLEVSELATKSEEEQAAEKQALKEAACWKEFIRKFNLDPDTDKEKLFADAEEAKVAFESFMQMMDEEADDEAREFSEPDGSDDDAY